MYAETHAMESLPYLYEAVGTTGQNVGVAHGHCGDSVVVTRMRHFRTRTAFLYHPSSLAGTAAASWRRVWIGRQYFLHHVCTVDQSLPVIRIEKNLD